MTLIRRDWNHILLELKEWQEFENTMTKSEKELTPTI